MYNFKLFFAGICIGIGNLLPGLSGATIAIFFGIYENIIDKLSIIFRNPKKLIIESKFFIPLIIGSLMGIIVFSFAIEYLIENHLFLLKLGLLFLISSQLLPLWKDRPNLNKSHLFLAIFVFISMMILSMTLFLSESSLFTHNNLSLIYLGLSGFFAASALILPGLSGALVLVLMGSYSPIISAIKSLNLSILISVFIGALLGLATLTFLIKWLYKNYKSLSYAIILGLVFGSLGPLWPSSILIKEQGLALLCCLSGIVVSKNFIK